jgi:hypothetical protein
MPHSVIEGLQISQPRLHHCCCRHDLVSVSALLGMATTRLLQAKLGPVGVHPAFVEIAQQFGVPNLSLVNRAAALTAYNAVGVR